MNTCKETIFQSVLAIQRKTKYTLCSHLGSFLQGSLYHQPQQCTITRETPQHCNTFELQNSAQNGEFNDPCDFFRGKMPQKWWMRQSDSNIWIVWSPRNGSHWKGPSASSDPQIPQPLESSSVARWHLWCPWKLSSPKDGKQTQQHFEKKTRPYDTNSMKYWLVWSPTGMSIVLSKWIITPL